MAGRGSRGSVMEAPVRGESKGRPALRRQHGHHHHEDLLAAIASAVSRQRCSDPARAIAVGLARRRPTKIRLELDRARGSPNSGPSACTSGSTWASGPAGAVAPDEALDPSAAWAAATLGSPSSRKGPDPAMPVDDADLPPDGAEAAPALPRVHHRGRLRAIPPPACRAPSIVSVLFFDEMRFDPARSQRPRRRRLRALEGPRRADPVGGAQGGGRHRRRPADPAPLRQPARGPSHAARALGARGHGLAGPGALRRGRHGLGAASSTARRGACTACWATARRPRARCGRRRSSPRTTSSTTSARSST